MKFAQTTSRRQSRSVNPTPRIAGAVIMVACIGIIAIQWPAHGTSMLPNTKTGQVVPVETQHLKTQHSLASLSVQIYLYGTDGSPIYEGSGIVQEGGVYDALFNLVGYTDTQNPSSQNILDVNGVVIGFYTLDTSPGIHSSVR